MARAVTSNLAFPWLGERPAPWKVDFEVGPDIRITTSGFIALRRAPPKTWSKCLARPATGEEDLELKADVNFKANYAKEFWETECLGVL